MAQDAPPPGEEERIRMISIEELQQTLSEHRAGAPQMYEGKRIQRCQKDNDTWPCRTARWAETLQRVMALPRRWDEIDPGGGMQDAAEELREALDG